MSARMHYETVVDIIVNDTRPERKCIFMGGHLSRKLENCAYDNIVLRKKRVDLSFFDYS